MSLTRDLVLANKYSIHLAVIPRLGLIIIDELEDFSEDWIEVKIVDGSKFDVRTLSGSNKTTGATRYLIDRIKHTLSTNLTPEQIGNPLKFVVNINLRNDILDSTSHVVAVGNELASMINQV